jgi:hypothetical protein
MVYEAKGTEEAIGMLAFVFALHEERAPEASAANTAASRRMACTNNDDGIRPEGAKLPSPKRADGNDEAATTDGRNDASTGSDEANVGTETDSVDVIVQPAHEGPIRTGEVWTGEQSRVSRTTGMLKTGEAMSTEACAKQAETGQFKAAGVPNCKPSPAPPYFL